MLDQNGPNFRLKTGENGMGKPSHLKVFSLTLTVVVFTTNCLLAHAPEANLWEQRRVSQQLAALPASQSLGPLSTFPSVQKSLSRQLSTQIKEQRNSKWVTGDIKNEILKKLLTVLPAQYGSVRDISIPKQGKTDKILIHIQDVHRNQEAQKNIGATLQELMAQNQIDLVALEGGFEPLDFSPFREFSHQGSVQTVADYLLRENKLTGAVHAGLVSSAKIPPFVGVDDPTHYQANVQAVREATQRQEEYRRLVDKLKEETQEKKKKIFNANLFAFDKKVENYRRGQMELGDFVEVLAQLEEDRPIVISIFLEALRLERSLNFAQVELERSHLLDRLLKKLTPKQTSTLINTSLAFRTGQLSHADFYSSIKNLCQKNGVPLGRFKVMSRYLQYILLSDSIDVETLMSELKNLEDSIYSKLTQSTEEQDLLQKSREGYLVGKLIDFALTKEEWKEFKASQIADLPVRQAGFRPARPAGGFQIEKINLKSFWSFYKQAEFRDQAMAENLTKAIKEHKAKVTVLVTGGFHAKGIKERFDATIISFIPKITQVDNQNSSAYLSVFTQEKTPLEKLFEGKKLFLVQEVWPVGLQKTAGTFLVAVGSKIGGLTLEAMNLTAQKLGLVIKAIVVNPEEVILEGDDKVNIGVPFKDNQISGWPYLMVRHPARGFSSALLIYLISTSSIGFSSPPIMLVSFIFTLISLLAWMSPMVRL